MPPPTSIGDDAPVEEAIRGRSEGTLAVSGVPTVARSRRGTYRKVAMLSAAALQAKRQQQNDQMKAGASPLGGSAPGGGGRGPGRGN